MQHEKEKKKKENVQASIYVSSVYKMYKLQGKYSNIWIEHYVDTCLLQVLKL